MTKQKGPEFVSTAVVGLAWRITNKLAKAGLVSVGNHDAVATLIAEEVERAARGDV